MNKAEMTRTVATLASGTLARLFDTVLYTEIDTHTASWINWIACQPDSKTWETWHDCWAEYEAFWKTPVA